MPSPSVSTSACCQSLALSVVAATVPTCASNTQSAPKAAAPVLLVDAEISAPVASAKALANARPDCPSATLQP